MITVNLLPPEYRKVEGTPIARFVALLAGVFLTASATSAWGYVHFGMLAEEQERRATLQEELMQLEQLKDRSQALANELKEYQKRRDTIEKIGASRILWSKKLDELADLIHNDGDTTRHLVWLRDLKSGFKNGAATLDFKGLSGGEEWSKLSDFNKDIKNDEDFFADFLRIDAPAGRRKAMGDGRVPAFVVEFGWGLEMKPTDKKK